MSTATPPPASTTTESLVQVSPPSPSATSAPTTPLTNRGTPAVGAGNPLTGITALSSVAHFVAAARETDDRLKAAAALINTDIDPDALRIRQVTARAVQAADPALAARAVPAGLPAPLLAKVMIVYSDLVARRAAMSGFAYSATLSRKGPDSDQAKFEIGCLGNGSVAARRFATDMTALTSLARSLPRVTPASRTSRAAAELAVHIATINLQNNCSDQCGGYIQTQTKAISWKTDPSGGKAAETSDGWCDVIYSAGIWHVNIHAC